MYTHTRRDRRAAISKVSDNGLAGHMGEKCTDQLSPLHTLV